MVGHNWRKQRSDRTLVRTTEVSQSGAVDTAPPNSYPQENKRPSMRLLQILFGILIFIISLIDSSRLRKSGAQWYNYQKRKFIIYAQKLRGSFFRSLRY